jgi:hypothetical protein
VLALPRLRQHARIAIAAAACLAVAAAFVAEPLARSFSRPLPDTRDAGRLLTVSGHGRTLLWRTAWADGRAHPLAGSGAGTWRHAAVASTGRTNLPANAHSLELETFAELGALGVAALALFFVAVFRRRGDPAALAVVVAWALVSAVDWDWQLPAATIPAMLAAGTVTASRKRRSSLAVPAIALALGMAAAVRLLY